MYWLLRGRAQRPQMNTFPVRDALFATQATRWKLSNTLCLAGVENEESGEKWRAGDAAKSARAFCRAIEIYDAGLKKFPQSMDLAFNK